MTAADETISEYATRADFELLRRDLQLAEERLRGELHRIEDRLIRWMVGTAIVGLTVGGPVVGAVSAGVVLLLT